MVLDNKMILENLVLKAEISCDKISHLVVILCKGDEEKPALNYWAAGMF